MLSFIPIPLVIEDITTTGSIENLLIWLYDLTASLSS